MDTTEKTGYFKCPKCGEPYSVDDVDLEKKFSHYTCEKCGATIDADYFVYCPHCEKIVGLDMHFTWKGFAKYVGKEFIKGINPIYGIKSLGRLMDKKKQPYDHGQGTCPFCDTFYSLCPNCHSAVEIGPETKSDDILFCTECGQKFRKQ
ncbi:MAG: hypothetical protein MJY56_00940 [Bacteroidales bacterium]|nr:hypothetical protein [Bacteroidales bacterium]